MYSFHSFPALSSARSEDERAVERLRFAVCGVGRIRGSASFRVHTSEEADRYGCQQWRWGQRYMYVRVSVHVR